MKERIYCINANSSTSCQSEWAGNNSYRVSYSQCFSDRMIIREDIDYVVKGQWGTIDKYLEIWRWILRDYHDMMLFVIRRRRNARACVCVWGGGGGCRDETAQKIIFSVYVKQTVLVDNINQPKNQNHTNSIHI